MMFLASLVLAASVTSAQDLDEFDCADFDTQQQAQTLYENNDQGSDPFFLDADNDGIAREELEGKDSLDSEDNGGFEDDDYSISGNEDEDQQYVQTPQTGGTKLLVIAAGLSPVLGVIGIGLPYRRW